MEDLDLVTEACFIVLYYVRLFKILHVPLEKKAS